MIATFRHITLIAVFVGICAISTTVFAAELALHVMDVGQGDSILVISPTGKTALIDAGPPESAKRLATRLQQLVQGPIDLLLMTHAHADHMGGMKKVVEKIGARIFMEPGFDHPSALYRKLLETLETRHVALKIAEAGRNIDLGGGASLHILAPAKPFISGTRSDVNANSVVLRLTYGKTAFYLAADSELETERRILASNEELSADVYKVAHHGSRHSSSAELLARVRPRIAVVSVGARNEFGHPTPEALARLEEGQGARVLRTDIDGEVTLKSDGEKVTVITEKAGQESGSRRSE